VLAVKTVACPTCGKHTPFTPENPFRPFCSQRCKLIDLGEWAKESYSIPDEQPGSLPDQEDPQ